MSIEFPATHPDLRGSIKILEMTEMIFFAVFASLRFQRGDQSATAFKKREPLR
jgi:hypothetical protein